MKRIRVLQFISDLDTGGSEKALARLVKRMDKKRFEVIVCSIYPPGKIGDELKKQNHAVISLGIKSKRELPFAFGRLVKVIRDNKIDLVQSYLFLDNLIARFACNATHTISVNGKRDIDILKSKTRVFVDTLTAPLASVIVSNSMVGIKEWESRNYPRKRLILIPNGITLSKYARDGSTKGKYGLAGKFVIGSVGRLSWEKGHIHLLDAFRSIHSENRDSILLLVGDGPLRRKLELRAKRFGLSRSVVFLGDRTDVIDLLHAMDVFVLPSLWEGNSNALIESMAVGLPIVATSVGGNTETVSDNKNGILVRSKDSRALSAAIVRLMNDTSLRKRLSAAARRDSRQFDIGKTVKAYESLYMGLYRSRRTH